MQNQQFQQAARYGTGVTFGSTQSRFEPPRQSQLLQQSSIAAASPQLRHEPARRVQPVLRQAGGHGSEDRATAAVGAQPRQEQLRGAQPPQSPQLQQWSGAGYGSRVGVTSVITQPPRANQQPLQPASGYGMQNRSVGVISGAPQVMRPESMMAQVRPEAQRATIQRLAGSGTEERAASHLDQSRREVETLSPGHGSEGHAPGQCPMSPQLLSPQLQQRTQGTAASVRPELQQYLSAAAAAPAAPPAVAPAAVAPVAVAPTSVAPAAAVAATAAAAIAPASAPAPTLAPDPARHRPFGSTAAATPKQEQHIPYAVSTKAPTSSRASWPSVQKPNPRRIEEKVISLDEFLDVTNAVAPETPVAHLEAMQEEKKDTSLSPILREMSSVSKAEFEQQMSLDNAENHISSPSNGLPTTDSLAEDELDKERSTAAAALLCHTATPKLSLHPRGLRGVGGPVTFSTVSQLGAGAPKEVGQRLDGSSAQTDGQPVSPTPKPSEGTEDISLTWKILGVADKVTQFFSALRPEEHRRFTSQGMRHTLPNPKRLQHNQLFELRQQDQMKQAAYVLRDAVMKLIAASGTTNADAATYRLPAEIRSKFNRLRLNLVRAFARGQKPASDANALAVNLERFASMCNYLAQADPGDIDYDVRQEFISFSQRHAQDLESHCRTFRWLAEQRGGPTGFVSGVSARPPPAVPPAVHSSLLR